MKNYNTFLKNCNTEQELQNIQKIKDLFEGSLEFIPVISEDKQKDFRSAYAYIMQAYKLEKNIKPCVAYTLINGLADGWRVNALNIAYECLRASNGNYNKALALLRLYLENSAKKKTRTLSHLEGALHWILRHKDFKISCNFLSGALPCVGSKEACDKIRGIKHKARRGFDMELSRNQKALYLRNFIENGHNLRLSKRASDIYFFLLQKTFEANFETLFVSYEEIARGIGIKDRLIKPYLEELKRENLIAFTLGKSGRGSKVATEIKVLDITGQAENKAEKLFQEVFNN